MNEFDEIPVSAKSIQDCFRREQQLGRIVEKAHFLHGFNQCWQSLLPPHLQNHSHVANFEQGELCVFVTNAQRATELRYSKPALLRQLKATPFGADLQQIRIQVNPGVLTTTPPVYPHEPVILSAASARIINEAAASVADPELKESLLRIAKCCPSGK